MFTLYNLPIFGTRTTSLSTISGFFVCLFMYYICKVFAYFFPPSCEIFFMGYDHRADFPC